MSSLGSATITRRHFLRATAALASNVSMLSCAARIPLASTPNPSSELCSGTESRPLKILTWNIFMMPPWINESPHNERRANAIAKELLACDFDILCLQKVFDPSARAVLEAALGERYPHRFGPANDSCSLKVSSGVWVLSRHPLVDYREIQFDDCRGVECMSRKGAVLLTGACGRSRFRLIATHLQGEEGPSFTAESQRIRYKQMDQIRDLLVKPSVVPLEPILISGDFCTPRFNDYGSESYYYRRMLATFEAENGRERRITLNDSSNENDLAIDKTGRQNELDYILVRPNGCDLRVERTRHVFQHKGWDPCQANRADLSYRYAVSAAITFGDQGIRQQGI